MKPPKRRGRPPGSGAGRDYTKRANVPLAAAQARAYAAAAKALGVPLAEWIRQACDEAEREQRKGTPAVPIFASDRKTP